LTPEAEQLRALARQYAAGLLERGFEAVAATGSVARGDAIAGSDIDLWAIAPEGNQVFHDSIGGRSVTVFAQALEHAIALPNLSLFDVDGLWVIGGDARLFQKIRSTFERHRKRIFAGIFDATVREVFTCLQLSRTGGSLARLVYLREAALRAAGLDVGRREGLRVPRYRHFSASYRGKTLADLRVALGVEGCTAADRRRLVRGAELYAASLGDYFARALPEASPVRVPLGPVLRLEAGDDEEALLALRARFEQQCLTPLRRVQPGDAIEALKLLPNPVRAFFAAMHLATASERVLKTQVAKTRAALSRFMRASGMDRLLSAAFYLSDEAVLD
jgi:hypothetical protein